MPGPFRTITPWAAPQTINPPKSIKCYLAEFRSFLFINQSINVVSGNFMETHSASQCITARCFRSNCALVSQVFAVTASPCQIRYLCCHRLAMGQLPESPSPDPRWWKHKLLDRV